MKKGLLIAGLILSLGAFLVMLRGVLFISLDGILALPIFGGMSYIFARKLLYRDGEIMTHIGWVLVANGMSLVMILLLLPRLGDTGVTEINLLILLFGLGVLFVVVGNKRRNLKK